MIILTRSERATLQRKKRIKNGTDYFGASMMKFNPKGKNYVHHNSVINDLRSICRIDGV